jgi:PAS domain S-box-containing protein
LKRRLAGRVSSSGSGRRSAPGGGPRRRKAECHGRTLRRDELAELAAVGMDWMWEADAEHRFTWLSPGFAEITGLVPDAIVGHARLQPMLRAGSGGAAVDLEARQSFRDVLCELKDARESCRWIALSGVPRHGADGTFAGYRGAARNVTALVAPHGSGSRASAGDAVRLRDALNAMSDAFCYYDAEDRLVLFNDAMLTMYAAIGDVLRPGMTFEELIRAALERGLWDTGGMPDADFAEAVLAARRGPGGLQSNLHFSDGRWVMHREKRTDDGGTIGICTDITDIKQHERKLERARAEAEAAKRRAENILFDLHRTLDSVELGVVLLDRDLEAQIINKAFYRIWRLEAGQVARGDHFRALMDINRHNGIYDVADEDWESYVGSRIDEILNGDVAPREFHRADGRTMIYAVTALSDGKRLVTYFDVTSMKDREAQLAEALEKAKLAEAVINSVPNAMFVKDSDLNFVMANQSFANFFGKRVDEIVGRRAADFVSAEEAALFEESERDVMEHGGLYEVEEDYEFEGRGQSRLVRKNRVRTGSGKDYVAGSIFDISELKERERALRESMAQIELYRHVLDELPVSTYVKDARLGFEFVNKAWCEITGVDKDEAIGRTDEDFFGDEGSGFAERDRAVLSDGEMNVTEETLTHRDGSMRQLIARKSRIVSSDGAVHLIGSSTDITELKQREAELVEAQQRAVLADRAKSEFLANMSHEIRTPMNGVLGMAELLARSELEVKQRTFVDIIVKSGNALLTIINDILDFSKIDAGQLVLDQAPFNLAEAIEDVATLVSARAKEKDLELIVRFAPGLSHGFVGDAGRMRQIITNLLGNAVKFTDRGHVLIDVSGEEAGDETRLTIAVTDTGIGIPAGKLEMVFEQFSQVDASSTRRHEGTGLGLAITSRLVTMMGGTIGVQSAEGEGSTFWFTVTLRRAEQTGKGNAMPIDVTGARILIIDDNEVNRAILSEQMTGWGFDACAAESGSEGLAVLRAAAELDVGVDCIVLDYQMPGMSGTEVAKAIHRGEAGSRPPIVMLTSVDQSLTQPAHRSLGIVAQLTKPARSSALLEAIVEAIRETRSGEPPVPAIPAVEPVAPAPAERAPARTAPSRVEVLVAEDNEVNQLVFTQILGDSGYSFEIASNGRKAVEAFRELAPAMILMDVSMPEMNGLEATAEIRRIERELGGHVPIIGVTAHALKGDRERCLEAGMDDYLSKPISPRALMEKIARWIGREKVPLALG